jgi:hypothetical protein
MSGASGSGKTTVILQALKAWENKEDFPFTFDATSVGYLVADRGEGDVKELADSLGLKKVKVYGFVGDKSFPLTYLKDADLMLEKCLDKVGRNHDLIILDPLLPFMREKNTKDLTATMLSLIPFSRKADSENITILGSHHSTKTRTDFSYLRAQDRSSGSAGMQGYSCVQLALVEGVEMGAPLHMLEITPHREARTSYFLERGEGGWFRVVERGHAKLGKLRSVFQESEALPKKDIIEIGKAMGIPQASIYRQLEKLTATGVLVQDEKGVYKVGGSPL